MDEFSIRLPRRLRSVTRLTTDEPWRTAPPPSTVAPPAPVTAPESDQREQQQEQLRILADRIATQLSKLDRQREEQSLAWHQAAIELAIAITARLLRREIDRGTFPIDAVVRELLGSLADAMRLEVFLHPADLQLLQSRTIDWPASVRFVADPALGRGDCRIEDGDRVRLASLTDHLHQVREEMLRSLAQ